MQQLDIASSHPQRAGRLSRSSAPAGLHNDLKAESWLLRMLLCVYEQAAHPLQFQQMLAAYKCCIRQQLAVRNGEAHLTWLRCRLDEPQPMPVSAS